MSRLLRQREKTTCHNEDDEREVKDENQISQHAIGHDTDSLEMDSFVRATG